MIFWRRMEQIEGRPCVFGWTRYVGDPQVAVRPGVRGHLVSKQAGQPAAGSLSLYLVYV